MQKLIANWKNMTLAGKLVMAVLVVAIAAIGSISLLDIPLLPTPGADDAERTEQDAGSADDEGAAIELTESQKEAIDSYEAADEELIARLQNGLWTTLDEKTVITFSARTFTVSSSGNAGTPRPYAILSHTDIADDPYSSDYELNTVAAVETDEGVSILNLQHITQGSSSTYALDWSDVANGTLLQVSLARTVRIEGNVGVLAALLGESAIADIESEVQAQAVEYYPTATVATWSGEASVDWNERTLLSSFILNNSEGTHIEIEREIPDSAGRS